MFNFKKMINTVKLYNELAEIEDIARRYFALNSFEGIMTTLGIISASFFAGIYSKMIIMTACIGAAIAITISGFYGAYLTESAERKGKIKALEKRTGLSFKRTPLERAHKFAAIALGSIEGFTPLLISLIIISPFLIFEINKAYYISFMIGSLSLFLMGVFLGKVSKSSLIKAGIKMVLAGIICAIALFIIEHLLKI